MGILQTILGNKDKELTIEATQKAADRERRKRVAKGEDTATGNTPDDILTDDAEVERLSKYIDEKEAKKILDNKSALKHGVEKIGTRGDTAGVLGFKPRQLLYGATRAAKKYAARILSDKWAAANLVEKIPTKAGREIVGKMVSKNVYIKEVSYMRGAKRIHYLQARSTKTGRVVAMRAAKGLLTRRG